ncbi:serine protease family protein [Endozoicomonas euniceicola]|uniref:Peptidase S1 domain-containing protein n=1 Tax=Endozoicomonas euniceicola TaxID=1234143 RepID=A0ABY6GXF3_9GAMM|nr:hypothetical protein [Endozoicomonas euniceicola]UYM17457.1 hypothetical protein NX720_05925 [Endozoicomonas euniceicola]
MSNIQTIRAVLFTSLLFPVFCSMAETSTKAIKAGVSNWLASLETIDFNTNPISCHAVIIHKNWALTTNDCVPKKQHRKETIVGRYYQESLEPWEKIVLRFSTESEKKGDQVTVSEVWRPSTYHTSYPILLKLESTLNPPFPTLSFKKHSWFDELGDRLPLWTVYYLERLKHENAVKLPEINLHFHPVRVMDQSNCHPFVRALDWKICSIPEGSGQVLSREFQRGAVLLDKNSMVVGLGYAPDQWNTTETMNYFIPLGLTPFENFIKETTGIENQPDIKLIKGVSEL